jgi:hypothetical protein
MYRFREPAQPGPLFIPNDCQRKTYRGYTNLINLANTAREATRAARAGALRSGPRMIARRSRLPRRLALLACAHLSSATATELPSFRLAPPAAASLGAALQSAVAAFATAAVPEAEVSAQHLLARAAGFGSSRSALTAQLDAPLSEPARSRFEQMCSRRLARQPVQYILGDWDFHELTLQLRAPVLIPRPETEQLVEMVLAAHGTT